MEELTALFFRMRQYIKNRIILECEKALYLQGFFLFCFSFFVILGYCPPRFISPHMGYKWGIKWGIKWGTPGGH